MLRKRHLYRKLNFYEYRMTTSKGLMPNYIRDAIQVMIQSACV